MTYIGIPYKKNGRGYDGCDCFGLVLLYYRDALGITLPDYLYGGISIVADCFERALQPDQNDIITFDFNGDRHVGVALGHGRFLHNLSRLSSSIGRLAEYKDFITGVYRYAHHSH